MIGEGDILPQNVCKCSIPVLALERGRAVQHFVNQDAECPPIHSARVAAALDDLGRDVFLGADERIGAEVGDARARVDGRQRVGAGAVLADDHGRLTTRSGLFGQVKVGEHDVAGLVEEDVYEKHVNGEGGCVESGGLHVLSGLRSR
jgi:hypothetical protein